MKKTNYYAIYVRSEKESCIVENWDDCKRITDGTSRAIFKKFKTHHHAKIFLAALESGKTRLQAEMAVNEALNKALNAGNELDDNSSMALKTTDRLPHKGLQWAIYTDGSFIDSNNLLWQNTAGWGFAVLNENKIIYEDYGIISGDEIKESRNIAGELEAVARAIRWLKENHWQQNGFMQVQEDWPKVHIFHDYIGISHWVTGRWKAKRPVSIKYKKRVENFKQYIAFHKVAAHSAVSINERVDKKTRAKLLAYLQSNDGSKS